MSDVKRINNQFTEDVARKAVQYIGKIGATSIIACTLIALICPVSKKHQ